MAASFENLAACIDPSFHLRHSFADFFWPSSVNDDHDFHSLLLQPQQPDNHHHHNYMNQQQQSLSLFSSSDLEQNQPKPTATATPEPSPTPNRTIALNGKSRITKRKSRATKKNQTTFIKADPANFRQMVQQVTGIRFDSSSSSSSTRHPSLSQFLKPEIRRPVGRLYDACLPTLDTSSFLLNQSQSLVDDRSIYGLNSVGFEERSGNGGGEGGYGASDGFACFPTLESWKVM